MLFSFLDQQGCEGGEQCLLFVWHQRLDANLLRSTLRLVGTALPVVSLLGGAPSDRKNFDLAFSETVKSVSTILSPPTPKIPFLPPLSAMSSLL